jgi:arylsulfatase A-like enzyme
MFNSFRKGKLVKTTGLAGIVSAIIAMIPLLAGCGGKAEQTRTSLLLITVDTLRADHLGCYGYFLNTSPGIDNLASRGVRFADCTPQWPKTWPSIASLLTGSYPKSISRRHRFEVLNPELDMMSKSFKAAGYETAAVVANFNVGKSFGFDKGFDRFIESWEEKWREETGDTPFKNAPGRVKAYTNATIVTDQAIKWMASRKKDRPFFLWLHYMDPHGPYVPPDEYKKFFRGAHRPEPVNLRKLPGYQVRREEGTGDPIADLAFYRTQYDREIRYVDDEIDRLMVELAGAGADGNTLVALTSDHGESFREHGYYLEHGMLSYQACSHVPLILVKKDVLPAGKVIAGPVGLIDLSTTLLALCGVEIPPTFEGQDLSDLVLEEEGAKPPDFVFMESGGHRVSPQTTVRHGKWKLIRVHGKKDRRLMAGTEFELYDLSTDPAETHNVAAQHPGKTAELGKILAKWYATPSRQGSGAEEFDLDTLDERQLEMLRALGYIK